jgi:ribosomal protein S18 acetylase RimI-like enzyme
MGARITKSSEENKMNVIIRPHKTSDINDLINLTLQAFEPIFISFEKILGPSIYPILYPDWRKSQTEGVEKISQNKKISLWVAEVDGKVVGYIAYELNDDKTAEVQLLAVIPDYQNHGIGTQLNTFALQKMKDGGMKLAIVSTGGDESHVPARRSYEKAGYTALPLVKYYRDL